MARPTVLMFPHTAALVHLPMGTITSRLPHMRRMAEFGPPFENVCDDTEEAIGPIPTSI
jgi:hypothetical protein